MDKGIAQFYEQNRDFREYVDRFSKCKNQPVETVLSWAITRYKMLDIQGILKVGDPEKK
ncbi:MAG: hypothetical protein K6G83_02010 [Lachnospiraceae bacterium]|nr:hypothetical protein [Lachnospiraceae bacterium]